MISTKDISKDEADRQSEKKTLADEWIIHRLNEVIASVTQKMDRYEFSAAGEELRDFTWNDFADWYLEISKVEGEKAGVLWYVLSRILPLWHPFMPFVTEHIWSLIGYDKTMCPLIVAPWPSSDLRSPISDLRFETLRTLITDMRRLRAEQGIEPVKLVEFVIVGDDVMKRLVESNIEVVKQLTRSSSVSFVPFIEDGWVTAVSGMSTIGLNLAGAVDLEKEKAKLQKELAEVEPYIVSTKAKLENAEFTSRAPAHVIDGMKAKLEEAEGKKTAIEERLGKMK